MFCFLHFGLCSVGVYICAGWCWAGCLVGRVAALPLSGDSEGRTASPEDAANVLLGGGQDTWAVVPQNQIITVTNSRLVPLTAGVPLGEGGGASPLPTAPVIAVMVTVPLGAPCQGPLRDPLLTIPVHCGVWKGEFSPPVP